MFKELTKTFLKNYSINIYTGTTNEELFSIVQEPSKLLQSFVKRFSKAVAEIPNCNDIVALLAFKRGLTPNSSFLNEICNWKLKTITEALVQAQGLIKWKASTEHHMQRGIALTSAVPNSPASRETIINPRKVTPGGTTVDRVEIQK